MSIRRRCGALITALLLLQLTLLGSGASCTPASASARAAAVAAGMDDMPGHAPARGQSHGCDASIGIAACASMPSCASTPTLPPSTAVIATLALPSHALPEPGSVASRPASGPDAPPPRG